MSTSQGLYRSPDGVYWFGDDQGVVPLAPTASEFLSGFLASLRFAADLDQENRSTLALSLDFVSMIRPDHVASLVRLSPEES